MDSNKPLVPQELNLLLGLALRPDISFPRQPLRVLGSQQNVLQRTAS